MKHTLSVLVENQAGVLSKISDPGVSRITIVADGDDYVLEQLEKQLNKLIPVIKVKAFESGNYISRELSLIKVNCTASRRPEVIKIAEMMHAKVVDVAVSTITLEFSDTAEQTEIFMNLLKPYGIREIVRTGTVAIEKGTASVTT